MSIATSFETQSTGYFHSLCHLFSKKNGNKIDPIEIQKRLRQSFIKLNETDLSLLFDRMASTYSFEQIRDITDLKTFQTEKEVLSEAKSKFEDAKFYIQSTEPNLPSPIKKHLSELLDAIISVIEIIITSYGISDFFKPTENELHADFKFKKILMLSSLFGMLASLISILGITAGRAVTGSILCGFVALSSVWPLIKPKPIYLPANAKNWTLETPHQKSLALARKESLDEIANIIKTNRHALLVGPSRVGKTMTAHAFAQAVKRGDYPELKGKSVFCINTSDLLRHRTSSALGGGNDILTSISKAMGRHRNDIILVFDEIHNACNTEENIADKLKTFLDKGGEFPHVIGITTEDDYQQYVKYNGAFDQRFDKVSIKDTDLDETITILGTTLLQDSIRPIIQDGVLKYIFKNSSTLENATQPAASLKLLAQCLTQTGRTQKSNTEIEIENINKKIKSLRTQALCSETSVDKKILELSQQLETLQKKFKEEQEELEKLSKAQLLFKDVTKKHYLSILAIVSLARKRFCRQEEHHMKLFLLQKYMMQSLKSYIQETGKTLGIKTVIDKNLVDDEMKTMSVSSRLKSRNHETNTQSITVL